MRHALHVDIELRLKDSWAALDDILEAYTAGLTTEQRIKVRRARELCAEILIEMEDDDGHPTPPLPC
jgi:hypothetical protein